MFLISRFWFLTLDNHAVTDQDCRAPRWIRETHLYIRPSGSYYQNEAVAEESICFRDLLSYRNQSLEDCYVRFIPSVA